MAQQPDAAECRRVARLFHRAGFGASRAVIDEWAVQGYAAAVEGLLDFAPYDTRPEKNIAEVTEAVAPGFELDGFDMGTFAREWTRARSSPATWTTPPPGWMRRPAPAGCSRCWWPPPTTT